MPQMLAKPEVRSQGNILLDLFAHGFFYLSGDRYRKVYCCHRSKIHLPLEFRAVMEDGTLAVTDVKFNTKDWVELLSPNDLGLPQADALWKQEQQKGDE